MLADTGTFYVCDLYDGEWALEFGGPKGTSSLCLLSDSSTGAGGGGGGGGLLSLRPDCAETLVTTNTKTKRWRNAFLIMLLPYFEVGTAMRPIAFSLVPMEPKYRLPLYSTTFAIAAKP